MVAYNQAYVPSPQFLHINTPSKSIPFGIMSGKLPKDKQNYSNIKGETRGMFIFYNKEKPFKDFIFRGKQEKIAE